MKKIVSIFVAFSILIVSAVPAQAVDYSDTEYWENFCSPDNYGNLSYDDFQKCLKYKQQKQDDIDEQIENIKNDINKMHEVLKEVESQIVEKDAEIGLLENQIQALEEEIAALEEDILLKEQDIEKLDAQIKERMVQTQTYNNSFGFIDFLMGASDFVDFIQRISLMNILTNQEQEQIETLSELITQLEEDKQKIEEQKESIEVQKLLIEQAKQELEKQKAHQNTLLNELHEKYGDLIEEQARSQDSIDSIINNMPAYPGDGGGNINNDGFGMVVSGYRSAGTWYYPASFGGARHSGMDIAGPRGTPVVASFSGIVAIAQNITSVEGTRNPATGNHVMIIGSVNGSTYAIHMLHLQYNSIVVSPGQYVVQGQKLAGRGSTGNSTGPHTHIDLYNLGSMSVEEAYNYVRRTGSYTFGMNYHAYGWECSNKAPICRERPEDKIPY